MIRQRPLIIAHRGVTHSGFPENSLPAFQAVVDEGYDGVEMDVRLSRDKELVVFHDIRLERLTVGGRGMVRTKRLVDLRRLRLKSDRVETCIPSLAETLEIFRKTKVLLNIEIKSEMPMRGKIEERVISLIHRNGLHHQTIISSFNPLVIAKIHKIDPDIRTGFIYEKRLPRFNQQLAKGLVVNSWHPQFKGVTSRSVSRARQLGCTMYPWTVNNEKDMQHVLGLGVDGIITDFPHMARHVIHQPAISAQDGS